MKDNSQAPEWIKKIKAEDDLKTARNDAETQRQLLAAKTIQADGPTFWTQLLKELQLAIGGLGLIGLQGSSAKIDSAIDGGGEEAQHVVVSLSALIPQQTYTNLYYRPGGSVIRCHTQEGEAVNLRLCLHDGTVSALAANGPLDAERCAQAIVLPMVRKIRS